MLRPRDNGPEHDLRAGPDFSGAFYDRSNPPSDLLPCLARRITGVQMLDFLQEVKSDVICGWLVGDFKPDVSRLRRRRKLYRGAPRAHPHKPDSREPFFGLCPRTTPGFISA